MTHFHQIEVHKVNKKYLIFDFDIEEQEIEIRRVKFKNRSYVDGLTWAIISEKLMNQFVKELFQAIKDGMTVKSQERIFMIKNLQLTVCNKSINFNLMKFLGLDLDETHDWYVAIKIKEVHHSVFNSTINAANQSEISRKTAKKTENHLEKVDFKVDEYTPTAGNSEQNDYQYIPSSAERKKDTETFEAYSPQPINGNSQSTIHTYTPTSNKRHSEDKSDKRRAIDFSPMSLTRSKRKKQEELSQDSCASSLVVLDSDSDHWKNEAALNKSKDLFGDDSDENENPENTIVDLAKKYEDLPPPKVKGKSRKVTSKVKASHSGKSQTTINNWISAVGSSSDQSTPSTSKSKPKDQKPRSKTRKEREREELEAVNIAKMKQQEEELLENRDQLMEIHQQLDEQLHRPRESFDTEIKLPLFKKDELEQKFFIHKPELKRLFKSAKAERNAQNEFYLHVSSFLDHEIIYTMLDILTEEFDDDKIDYSGLLSKYLLPEWVLILFQDEFNMARVDVEKRLRWQTDPLNSSNKSLC